MKYFVALMLFLPFCFPASATRPNEKRTLPFMPYDKDFLLWVQALDLAVTYQSEAYLYERLHPKYQDEEESTLSSYPSITNLHEVDPEGLDKAYASELDSHAVPMPTRRVLSPLYEESEEEDIIRQ